VDQEDHPYKCECQPSRRRKQNADDRVSGALRDDGEKNKDKCRGNSNVE
jgi:hypothetical protein